MCCISMVRVSQFLYDKSSIYLKHIEISNNECIINSNSFKIAKNL